MRWNFRRKRNSFEIIIKHGLRAKKDEEQL